MHIKKVNAVIILIKIISVNKNPDHGFSKFPSAFINLIEGIGVEGDAHSGKTVKHTYLAKKNPFNENLRQVHLISMELIDELNEKGFPISPGDLGENITTAGIELISLPENTLIKLGPDAIIKITGLRDPCSQLDKFSKGLSCAVISKDENGELIKKCGVMSVVIKSGVVKPGDNVEIIYPEGEYKKLVCV